MPAPRYRDGSSWSPGHYCKLFATSQPRSHPNPPEVKFPTPTPPKPSQSQVSDTTPNRTLPKWSFRHPPPPEPSRSQESDGPAPGGMAGAPSRPAKKPPLRAPVANPGTSRQPGHESPTRARVAPRPGRNRRMREHLLPDPAPSARGRLRERAPAPGRARPRHPGERHTARAAPPVRGCGHDQRGRAANRARRPTVRGDGPCEGGRGIRAAADSGAGHSARPTRRVPQPGGYARARHTGGWAWGTRCRQGKTSHVNSGLPG